MSHLIIQQLPSSGLHYVPAYLFRDRACSQCLYWEDPEFWTGNDPGEILATKKKTWFARVSREFDPCGQVAILDDLPVGYSEYALPKHFPGILEYGIQTEEDIPFIACLAVGPQWQRRGYGSLLLMAVEADLARRGYKAAQSCVRGASPEAQAATLSFWEKRGYRTAGEFGRFVVVKKDLTENKQEDKTMGDIK